MSKILLRAPSVSLQLSEEVREDGLKKIQLLKTGNFFDPRYGKFSITRKHFSEMIDNFKNNVRGIDIALDYAHNTDGIAAGWFKELIEEPIGDGRYGLFALTEPTPPGKQTLDEKTYKYVSADFDPNYKDNEEGKSHGCVLEGAALTNRPVIKGMKAVQLSEYQEGDNEMDLQQAMAKIAELEAVIADLKKEKPAPAAPVVLTEDEPMTEAEKKLLSDTQAENEKLKGQIALSEKTNKFNIMLSEGTAVETQRKAYLDGDMDAFAKLSVKVKLSETGTEAGTAGDADKSKKQLEDEAAREIKDTVASKSMTLSEATKEVMKNSKYASLRE